MLKLLLDENIGHLAAFELREQGHDVKTILEVSPGLDDEAVLALAKEDARVLITSDRDFGRLIFVNSKKHVGVIYLRLKKESPENIVRAITEVLRQYDGKIRHSFITVSEADIRIR